METLIVCIKMYIILGSLAGMALSIGLALDGAWRMLFRPVNKKNTCIVWATIITLGPGCWAILVFLSIVAFVSVRIFDAIDNLSTPPEGK